MTEEESVRLRRLRNDSTPQGSAVRDVYADDCQSCGVCCVYYSQKPFGVPVRQFDHPPKKLVQIGPRLTYRDDPDWDTSRYMRTVSLSSYMFFGWEGFNKCAALEGKIGANMKCGIYDSRPHACSWFAPGSLACNRARAWAHLPPPDDIMELGHS